MRRQRYRGAVILTLTLMTGCVATDGNHIIASGSIQGNYQYRYTPLSFLADFLVEPLLFAISLGGLPYIIEGEPAKAFALIWPFLVVSDFASSTRIDLPDQVPAVTPEEPAVVAEKPTPSAPSRQPLNPPTDDDDDLADDIDAKIARQLKKAEREAQQRREGTYRRDPEREFDLIYGKGAYRKQQEFNEEGRGTQEAMRERNRRTTDEDLAELKSKLLEQPTARVPQSDESSSVRKSPSTADAKEKSSSSDTPKKAETTAEETPAVKKVATRKTALVVMWQNNAKWWRGSGPVQYGDLACETEDEAIKYLYQTKDDKLTFLGWYGKYKVYSLGRPLKSYERDARKDAGGVVLPD